MTHRAARQWLAGAAVVAAGVVPARAPAGGKGDGRVGEHMVVQRDRPVKLAGTGAPGEVVAATLAAGRATAKADARGRWSLALPALAAGGPFTLRVSSANGGANALTFNDVMVGEVW